MFLKREPWPAILCLGFFYVAILLFWRWNWLLFFLLVFGTVMLLAIQLTRRNTVLWITSTLWAGFGEYARVKLGIWEFVQPDWGGLPFWIFWVWGALMVSFVWLAEWLDQNIELALSGRRLELILRSVGFTLVIVYGILVFQMVSPAFGWVAVAMGLVVLACRPGRKYLILFWLAALLGLLGEVSGVGAGIYTYSVPLAFRPIILQFGWGLNAALLYGLSNVVIRIWRASGKQALSSGA